MLTCRKRARNYTVKIEGYEKHGLTFYIFNGKINKVNCLKIFIVHETNIRDRIS